MICPEEKEFLSRAESCNIIPVYREVMADMETPISIFQKINPGGPSFLLESGEVGEKFGRYSFMGCRPFLQFESRGDRVTLKGSGGEEERRGNPLEILREVLRGFTPDEGPELPRFYGGAVGYLGYDVIQHLEDVPLPPEDPESRDMPEINLIFPGLVLIYDHWRHTLKVVANARVQGDPREGYRRACGEIQEVLEALERGIPREGLVTGPPRGTRDNPDPSPAGGSSRDGRAGTRGGEGAPEITFSSNFEQDVFEDRVRRAQEHIAAGDIFQAVLSQRFEAPLPVHPFSLYRVLRMVNPSPYMYYLDYGDLKIAGSSPEPLVKLEKGMVETRPIAGTRPRGQTPEEDERLARELQQDEKERAEHIMLVDLARNDLGRICRYGSIEVENLFGVEKYSHVMHMVTRVTGSLGEGRDALDVLAACFPAGTVSGAPKIRAMEIISQLEPCRRGPYAGAIGYFSFSGNLDTCITIRTMVIKGGRVYVQAGAGIVADSRPDREYLETRHKAAALLRTLNLAKEGLPRDFSHR